MLGHVGGFDEHCPAPVTVHASFSENELVRKSLNSSREVMRASHQIDVSFTSVRVSRVTMSRGPETRSGVPAFNIVQVRVASPETRSVSDTVVVCFARGPVVSYSLLRV